MNKSNKLRNYKKHCEPDNILCLELAIKALHSTYNNFTEHPDNFEPLEWIISYN